MNAYCKTTYDNRKFNTHRLQIKRFQMIHVFNNTIFYEEERSEILLFNII